MKAPANSLRRFLILGDSHVSPYRWALLHEGKRKDESFDFFAQPSINEKNLGHLKFGKRCTLEGVQLFRRVELGTLEAEGDGFEPDGYSNILLVGLRLELPYKLWILQAPIGKLSEAAETAVMREVISSQSLALKVLRGLRASGYTGTVTVLPNPYLASASREMTVKGQPGVTPIGNFCPAEVESAALHLQRWKDAAQTLFLPEGGKLVFQPEDTVEAEIFTKEIYRPDLTNAPDKEDVRHMSHEYASIILKHLRKMKCL